MAQTTEAVYGFNSNDLKHYSLSPNPGKDEYFMAGTILNMPFNYPGPPPAITLSNAIHYMYIDNSGTQYYSRSVDDPGYDEHVVGTHYVVNDDAIIVASHKGGGTDGVEILRVNGLGNIVSSRSNIVNSDPTNTYTAIYPQSSMYDEANTTLYVCGFATLASGNPTFMDDKVAFVFSYDTRNDQVLQFRTYDKGYNPGQEDYDMAVRMRVLSNGDIWVGGSIYDGGIMNMSIDPISLAYTNYASIFNNTLFTNSNPANHIPGYYMSSFDIAETSDPDYYYVFSNAYDYTNPNSLDVTPRYLNITPVQKTDLNVLISSGNATGWRFYDYDYIWGNITLPSAIDSRVLLSGYQTNRSGNSAYPSIPTGLDNVNSYITELRLRASASTGFSVGVMSWNISLSVLGTGNPALANAYYQTTGSGLMGLPWPPLNTVNDKASTTDLITIAPVWNPSGNRLNMKMEHSDTYGQYDQCYWIPDHNIRGERQDMYLGATAATELNIPWQMLSYVPTDQNFAIDYIDRCPNAHYKQGLAVPASVAQQTTLSPNPAQSTIHLDLGSTYAADAIVAVALTDLMGRNIGLLYKGKTADMPLKLSLPSVTPGLYMVNILAAGKAGRSLKLSID